MALQLNNQLVAAVPRDEKMIIEKVSYAQELTTQLRALVLPSPPTDGVLVLVRDLFEDILRSLTAVQSELQLCCVLQSVDQSSKAVVKRVMDSEERADIHGSIKKRRTNNSWTTTTTLPHIDGHQWSKYGQKQIQGSKFSKSYYRCVNKDKGCAAKKTVQQKDGNRDPPVFEVAYCMQHTCKPNSQCDQTIISSSSDHHWDPSTDKISSTVPNIIMESSSQLQVQNASSSTDHGQNDQHDVSSFGVITGLELEEMLFSEPVMPVDTPPKMDDLITSSLSPMGSCDLDAEWCLIDELLGLIS